MFILNQVYKRSTIHDEYGGSRQNGISVSAQYPYIFIFTGGTGHQYGYADGWDNHHVFSYTGEGQVGDMTFKGGNLALLEHKKNGKRVFLFQAEKKSFVSFKGELELFDWDEFVTKDRDGQNRKAIRFFFKKIGELLDFEKDKTLLVDSSLYHSNIPSVTERSGLVTSRVGQGAYRKSILHRWNYKCAVTQYNDTRILIASHIVAWRESTDLERLDVDNGILLSPVYDALFDLHLISFEHNGKIIFARDLENYEYKHLGVTGKEKINNLTEKNKYYLERHRALLI